MFASRTNWDLTPNRLARVLERHKSRGQTVLDLAASNPTECGFHYDQAAISRAFGHPAALRYHPDPRGLPFARAAVSGYYAARGDQVAPEDLVLTVSTSEAYSFVFRLLCNPEDEVLVPAPSYPLFDFLADVNDIRLVRYPLFYDHGWHIDAHALEQVMTPRTRGIIVVHPNNPTGHYTKAAEIARLNELCRDRHAAIIADEVFLDFSLQGGQPSSFVANQGALTFTMSGVSKIAGLPQMKFAWLAVSGPASLKKEALGRLELISDTYLSMSTPGQLAAPAQLEQRAAFQRELMARVRKNLAELDAQLKLQTDASRLEIEGGWYAIVRVPATQPDEELAIQLLEKQHVYLHPGHFYGFPGEGHLVVSLIAPEDEFAEGIRRLLSAER